MYYCQSRHSGAHIRLCIILRASYQSINQVRCLLLSRNDSTSVLFCGYYGIRLVCVNMYMHHVILPPTLGGNAGVNQEKKVFGRVRTFYVAIQPSKHGLFEMHATVCRHGRKSVKFVGDQFSRTRRNHSVEPAQWQRSINSIATPAQEPVVFSGIQPTGVPHLGNYLGALRQWVKLQNDAKPRTKLLFSIVDLHALTVPQDAVQLRRWRTEAFATLLAVGLDPKQSTIFYQSAVRDTTVGLEKGQNIPC